jgi:hypothetical protein
LAQSLGNRVPGLMTDPLRPDFVHKVTDYASKKGFSFTFRRTADSCGRGDRPPRRRGLATVNLAIDSMDINPRFRKALAPIGHISSIC